MSIVEPLLCDYNVLELPLAGRDSPDLMVDTVLTARVVALETENQQLQADRKSAFCSDGRRCS